MKEIENIFSFKKTKNNCINQNNPVIIDTREKNSMILSILKQKNINIFLKTLNIGDYIIGEVTIERKTITDLFNSFKSKRLKEQLKNLKQCKKPLIILEKNKTNFKTINPKITNGIILSILLNYQIPIIYSNSEEHTSEILTQISKQQKREQQTNPNKVPKEIEEQKRFILEAFPHIGPKMSRKLLERLKSLKEIFNADKKDLKEILNKETSEDLIKILNHQTKF